MRKFKEIKVAGAGYVSLYIATLLAQNHPVPVVDPNDVKEKVHTRDIFMCDRRFGATRRK